MAGMSGNFELFSGLAKKEKYSWLFDLIEGEIVWATSKATETRTTTTAVAAVGAEYD